MTTELPPEALIAAARSGDRSKLETLLEAYRNYLRILARTSLRNGPALGRDPSDLAQETIFAAFERFHQFRGRTEKELTGWLRRILSRRLIDHVRRTGDGRLVLDAELDRSSLILGRLVPSGGTTPSLAAQRRELGVVLADALDALGEDDREVIVLRNLEERDWKEVGRRMNRTPDAARMLWTRALVRLKPLIEGKL